MRAVSDRVRGEGPSRAGEAAWIALAAGASVLFSLGLACAAPLAALAAVGGTRLSRRGGLALVAVAWLANQGVGYGLLGYPRTPDSLAWGAVIGLAALAAALAARAATRASPSPLAAQAAALAAAFVAYEVVLFGATAVLPSGPEAFAAPVVLRLLGINALALVGLLALHRAATTVGLLVPAPPATARA